MAGQLSPETMARVFSALPIDITYIDEDDIIRYYSDFRIFSRTPDIIGTTVQNCHSPSTRPEVNRVIDELKSGRKQVSEFSAEKNGRKVRVRYIAVRDGKGKYVGLLETAEWAE